MECGPLLRLLDRDPAVKRLGVGRERIRLQSAMRPEVELQLGGRTGSVEGKADRSEPVLPLRSVLTAEASLYSLFYPRLGCARRVPPLATPPLPPLRKGWTTCPSDSERACARFSGDFLRSASAQTVRKTRFFFFTHVVRSSVPLVGCGVLKVPYRARFVCVASRGAVKQRCEMNCPPRKCCDHYKGNI